jgi:Concanavalin A-like lectin/glucanases superfamily
MFNDSNWGLDQSNPLIFYITMKKIAYIISCTLLLFSCKVIDEIKKELLVKIQTSEAIGIYAEGCVLGGNVTDDGGKAVTEYGVCYATSPGPTTSSKKLLMGSGSGSYQYPIRNLNANTTYYCRAYCINAYGTTYGNEISFKTPDYTIPTFVGVPTTTSLNDNSIGIKCAVNFDGVMPLDWGFCFSESSNPTILNNKVKSTDLNGGGTTGSIFTAKLGSLKSNTTYYIRAYCTNPKGTGYSDQITVKTTADPALTAALAALKSGLQVYYPFNGNANDASGNGFNGTVTGATLTTDRYNTSSSAYSFDGKNGTRIKTNYFGVLGGASRTISVWAKQSAALGNNSPLVSYGNLNNVWGEGCIVSFGKLNNSPSVFFDNVASAAGVSFNVADNVWHHYVIVYDKTLGTTANAVKVYIDGVYYANNVFYNPYTINTVKGTSLVIGEYNAEIGDFRTFNGSLDDIGVWNRALSTTEIQLLYSNQL